MIQIHIAQSLAPLSRLRHLKVFLDWSIRPDEVSDCARDAAQVFARVLGGSLRVVSIHSGEDTWRVFTVAGNNVLEQRDLNA